MTASTDSHDAVTADWAGDVLDFWFTQLGEAGWWSHDPATDAVCLARFARLWKQKREDPAEDFLDRADHALAAVILFDQLPRNMFRGSADAFASDALAVAVARGALAKGYDLQIGGAGRHFFYMPFQHSEAIEDQDRSLELFAAMGDEEALDFAREHYAVIERFGRFPHRNAVLGRPDAPGEESAIAEGSQW